MDAVAVEIRTSIDDRPCLSAPCLDCKDGLAHLVGCFVDESRFQ